MNKIGIHYAYWGNNWNCDLQERINYAADLGLDAIDITPPDYMVELNKTKMQSVKDCAAERNIELSFCIGFPKEKNLASPNPNIREAGIEYSKHIIEAVQFMGGKIISGILYSSWPYLYDTPITQDDKKQAWDYALDSVSKIAPFAHDYGIDYVIELVNRFEQFILNSVDEGLKFCDDLGLDYVGLLLDVFHANIEEDDIAESIRKAGSRIKHVHISENNRKLPGTGNHLDWNKIFNAFQDVNYEGRVIIESFLKPFGPAGNDLRIWRNLTEDISKEHLDELAKSSILFIKQHIGGN